MHRRKVTLHGLALVAALVATALLAGCGTATQVAGADQPPHSDADTPTAVAQITEPDPGPFGLNCPSGEMSSTSGGYYTRLPDGSPTREQAVEEWLSHSEFSGFDYDTNASDSHAWVLRADGTRVARLEYLLHSGYTVHGVTYCLD